MLTTPILMQNGSTNDLGFQFIVHSHQSRLYLDRFHGIKIKLMYF
jgi:hypothetical protein